MQVRVTKTKITTHCFGPVHIAMPTHIPYFGNLGLDPFFSLVFIEPKYAFFLVVVVVVLLLLLIIIMVEFNFGSEFKQKQSTA